MNIKEKREEVMKGAMERLVNAHMHPMDPNKKHHGDFVMFNINQFKDPDGTVRPEIYKLGWLYGISNIPYNDFEDLVEEYYMNKDVSIFIISRSDLMILAMGAIAEQGLLRTDLVYVDGVDNYGDDIMVRANDRDSTMSLKAMIENQYLYAQTSYTGRDAIIFEVYEKIFPTKQEPGKFGAFAATIKNVVSKAFR